MKKTAYIFVTIAAALWGTIGIFSKRLSMLGFSILQIVTVRAVVSAVAIMVFLLLRDRKFPRIEIRDSVYFIGTGILSFAFFNWCYFEAINRTSLAVAAVLLYTAPAIVMILSAVLFKERMNGRKIAALVLTFTGCVLVSAFVKGTGQNISASGILAGLGSGLGYALYSIFGSYALRKYDSVVVTFYTFVFACIVLIPISNIKGMTELFISMNSVVNAISLGIVNTVLPFLLYTKGLTRMEAGKASIIATLEPVVATIVGITLLGEPVSIYKIAGILAVVIAVSMLVENSKSNIEEELSC